MKRIISDVVNFPNDCETVRFTWRGIGEYMGGDKLDWARGLKNKIIRRMIADCFKMVRDHDDYMLDALREGFSDI